MNVLVTGSNGFIGKNLIIRLNELSIQVTTYTRENTTQDLEELIKDADCVVHLAGENKPRDEKDFDIVNAGLTKSICDAVRSSGKNISIILASSTQADLDNAYGKSKLAAEAVVKALEVDTSCPTYVYRLPGVFGKWCRPNYNSVVATFCHNIANNLPIRVDNPDTVLSLVYIDDVIDEFIDYLVNTPDSANVYKEVKPVYSISLADLSSQIKNFKESTPALTIGNVGSGFARALYSTYISYLPVENFSYSIPEHSDDRGSFVEILKTDNNGQFSYFTAHPGVTRGGHYHHTKNEKFLVVKGRARFRFCHISTGEFHEIVTEDSQPKIVNTIPGWAHDITNIGDSDLVAVLWSNEIFDQNKPDTYIFEMD